VLVSSEVGCGIVPENRLSRKFRDMVGFANQSIAKAADHVVWMVAGIPVTIKYA
jgi:adenosylcobinamide kinase/adenosylcobinamide-phosphate guanylyltransferase